MAGNFPGPYDYDFNELPPSMDQDAGSLSMPDMSLFPDLSVPVPPFDASPSIREWFERGFNYLQMDDDMLSAAPLSEADLVALINNLEIPDRNLSTVGSRLDGEATPPPPQLGVSVIDKSLIINRRSSITRYTLRLDPEGLFAYLPRDKEISLVIFRFKNADAAMRQMLLYPNGCTRDYADAYWKSDDPLGQCSIAKHNGLVWWFLQFFIRLEIETGPEFGTHAEPDLTILNEFAKALDRHLKEKVVRKGDPCMKMKSPVFVREEGDILIGDRPVVTLKAGETRKLTFAMEEAAPGCYLLTNPTGCLTVINNVREDGFFEIHARKEGRVDAIATMAHEKLLDTRSTKIRIMIEGVFEDPKLRLGNYIEELTPEEVEAEERADAEADRQYADPEIRKMMDEQFQYGLKYWRPGDAFLTEEELRIAQQDR